MIAAISETTKDVVVPLLAAGIAAVVAAAGIVFPIIFFRRQELARVQIQRNAADDADLKRDIERLRNNVFLLREVLQRFGIENTLTRSQQQVVESARDRMFQMLYSDQRLFDSIIPRNLNSPTRIKKVMLTLGELEARLADTFTPAKATDPVMLFGLYTLCYFLEADEEGKTENFEVLKYLAEKNSAADSLFKALYENKSPGVDEVSHAGVAIGS
jgi:hypothetical protein